MKWGILLIVSAGVCFMLFFVNALAEKPHETAANIFALTGAVSFLSALALFGRALKKLDADRDKIDRNSQRR